MGREMMIGIMSKESFRDYTIRIAKGEIRPTESDPKIWFESVESMAQILSTKNQELLRTIREKNPRSLRELAESSGRKVSNLSRTLRTMERYGLVELVRDSGSLKPRVCADTFNAVLRF
jgi:predicted transcriptional regulator